MRSETEKRGPNFLILGGGPAGSSLAIRLAREGFGVTLIDKSAFPRPKLCGEFISPECLTHFAELGVSAEMLSKGGARILETRFYDRKGRSVVVPSLWFSGDEAALSLSRLQMDDCLLQAAKRAGAEVLTETSATSVAMHNGAVQSLNVRDTADSSRELRADFVIDATGRSAVMTKLIGRAVGAPAKLFKPPYVAFKVHLSAPNVERGRCEIYSFPGGYGGLSPVEGGSANLCFMVRADLAKELGGDIRRLLQDVVAANPQACRSLKGAEVAGEPLAVAIQSFGRGLLSPAANVFSVGDAAGFIDPFTGSGILMSLESSQLMAKSIFEYVTAPSSIAAAYARMYRERFQTRFRVCRILRHAAFHPNLATAAISLLGLSKTAREFLTKRTRGEYISEN